MSPSVDDMTKTYQTVIEKYERNGLFLNVVRSSKNLPLNFMTIPSITGSGSIGETAGIVANVVSAVPATAGGFLSAATGTYYSPSLGISLSRSFTFTQSSLDNSAFQKAFMTEIPLATINAASDVSTEKRELFYSMVIERLTFFAPDGSITRLDNDPSTPGYEAFQNKLHELVEMGFKTEMIQHYEPVGTPMTPSEVNDSVFKFLDVKEDKRLIIRENVNSETRKKTYQMYQKLQEPRFCFDKAAQADYVIKTYGRELICHERLDTKVEDNYITKITPRNNQDQYDIGITIRSTAKVFAYLGNIVKVQNGTKPYVPMLWSPQTEQNGIVYPPQKNVPILVVNKNNGAGRAFAEIDYEGDRYSIPSENSGSSTQVMSLLTGIVSLNKVPGSLPQTPAVLIK